MIWGQPGSSTFEMNFLSDLKTGSCSDTIRVSLQRNPVYEHALTSIPVLNWHQVSNWKASTGKVRFYWSCCNTPSWFVLSVPRRFQLHLFVARRADFHSLSYDNDVLFHTIRSLAVLTSPATWMGGFQADFQAELLSPWQQSEHVFPLISSCSTWSTADHHQELKLEPNFT